MSAPAAVSVSRLVRFVGLPDAPAILDVCTSGDFAADPRGLSRALLRPDRVPPRDGQGRTVWVTRSRAKVDLQAGHALTMLSVAGRATPWLKHTTGPRPCP